MEVEKCAFFKCADCQREFEKRMHYNRHRKTHERPYLCPLCSKAFGLKTDRERHKATHGLIHFKCAFPGCTFGGTSRKDYLWKHMQQKHQPEDDIYVEKNLRAFYEKSTGEVKATDENQLDLDLLEAAKEGDSYKILSLLSQQSNVPGTNPNAPSREQKLLDLAAKHETLAKILIEIGVGFDTKLGPGKARRPFFTAIKAGHENIVKFLLQNVEDVHALSKKTTGLSALCLAAKYGHENIVRLLLRNGGNMHSISNKTSGPSALFMAVKYGHDSIVEVLLQSSEDVHTLSNDVDEWGELSLLSIAVKYGHEAIVNLLLDHGAIHEPEAAKTNALIVAVQTNQEKLVVLLLERGADVNREEGFLGLTALHRATAVSPAMTQLIIDAKADLKAVDSHGRTPLGFTVEAFSHDNVNHEVEVNETIKLLINAGATMTPRHWEWGFSLEFRKDFAYLSRFVDNVII